MMQTESMWIRFQSGKFDDREHEIFNDLPHGSGIDAAWEISKMKGYYNCLNSYHVMSEHGYYVAWADFSVIIPKKNPEDFRLHFHGDRAHYLNKHYMLRDHLEDTMYHWISETFKKEGKLNV